MAEPKTRLSAMINEDTHATFKSEAAARDMDLGELLDYVAEEFFPEQLAKVREFAHQRRSRSQRKKD